MKCLIFAGTELRDLRRRLLADAPLESAGALVARVGRGIDGLRLVVIHATVAEPADYLDRSDVIAVLKPAFVARALKQARDEKASLLLVHTHPSQDWPEFSLVDARGEATMAPTLYARAPDGPHGSLVIGQEGFAARVVDETGRVIDTIDRLVEVSADVRVMHKDAGEAFDEMYDRNVRALGAEGQRRLQSLHVGIVGVGGTGSFVVEELSRLGVGRLTLIDDELIETTNLNRVVGSTKNDVGRPKVEALGEVAKRARLDIKLTLVQGSVLREEIARRLIDCDLVFCCTDSHGSRAVINQVAYQYLVPTFDIGVRIDAANDRVTQATSRVQMLSAGLPCLACHPLLSPDAVRRDLMTSGAREADPYIVGFQEPQPAVVSINGAAASSAVTMFLTATTGLPGDVRHLVGRPLEGTVRAAVGRPRIGCVVCASENAFRRADSWPVMWTE
jgi:hypothetical protein